MPENASVSSLEVDPIDAVGAVVSAVELQPARTRKHAPKSATDALGGPDALRIRTPFENSGRAGFLSGPLADLLWSNSLQLR
jgi:hypothetical protein